MTPNELAAAKSLLGLNNETGQFSLFFVYIVDLKKKEKLSRFGRFD